MIKPFWKWMRNERIDESGEAVPERVLVLHGRISDSSWLGDEVTPELFRQELSAGKEDISVWINSPGGDCFAAAQIYNMLMDYPGDVTVHIDGLAASAASVIAMAGTKVCMSPTACMMIHNPFTAAMGDTDEMRKAIQLLDEVKESIINAYQIKTGLSRTKLSHLMDAETWMNAVKAKELGFCDEILYTGEEGLPDNSVSGFSFERKAAALCLMNKVIAALPKPVPVKETEPEHPPDPEPVSKPELVTPDNRVKAADLEKRLSLIK